jgi:hypothetical protein
LFFDINALKIIDPAGSKNPLRDLPEHAGQFSSGTVESKLPVQPACTFSEVWLRSFSSNLAAGQAVLFPLYKGI